VYTNARARVVWRLRTHPQHAPRYQPLPDHTHWCCGREREEREQTLAQQGWERDGGGRESSTHRGRDGWKGRVGWKYERARERRRCRLCAFEHKAAGPPLLSSSSLPTARREITTRSSSATQEYEYSSLSCRRSGGGLSQIYRRAPLWWVGRWLRESLARVICT